MVLFRIGSKYCVEYLSSWHKIMVKKNPEEHFPPDVLTFWLLNCATESKYKRKIYSTIIF